MIKRNITGQIQSLAQQFRIVAITGPRQSGKTTLARSVFADYEYFNLEEPDVLLMIESDPRGFLQAHQRRIILDEVQKLPQLLSYIQVMVDQSQERAQFVLSGSQNLLLSEKINQSLAGRAAYVTLLPLTYRELRGAALAKKTQEEQIFAGFYPEVYTQNLNPRDFYNQYLATYIERDVKQISNIVNLAQFRRFLALVAGRIGQIVDKSSLANDVGVSPNAVENWLSVLEASYLIKRLQPYHQNFGKRYIKSPKIYFTDTGVACRLLGINQAEEIKSHYLRGGLFENLCIMELEKQLINNGSGEQLFFFRDSNQNEVDVILEKNGKQIPLEIKSSATLSPHFVKGIKFWQNLDPRHKGQQGWVIYDGEEFASGEDKFVNWQQLGELF